MSAWIDVFAALGSARIGSRLLPLAATLLVSAVVPWAEPVAAQTTMKIGVLNDRSGLFADASGEGSVVAARLAVEDFRATEKGIKVTIVSADHQNKPDVAATIARQWYDQDGVDVIVDVPVSSAALAVSQTTRDKNKVFLASGAATPDLTGKLCSPNTIHWTYDSYALNRSTATGMVKAGANSWFFLTADYAFGQMLERDTTTFVKQAGGKVVGSVRHPIAQTDFSSFLLQAQSSGAKVIGLANAGGDTVNAIKQASEFGITQGGQKLAGSLLFISDVHGLGLTTAQGVVLTEAFYWDLNDQTRAWSKRFAEKHNGNMPTMIQAGVYSAVLHYLKAVEALRSKDSASVLARMKDMPTDDPLFGRGWIRGDGRKLHDMYLFEVKKPAESKGRWDYYKLVAKIPSDQAFRPTSEVDCPLVSKAVLAAQQAKMDAQRARIEQDPGTQQRQQAEERQRREEAARQEQARAEAQRRQEQEGRDRLAAQQAATRKQPPTIRILSPRDGAEIRTPEVTVEYELTSPAGLPVDTVEILLDGRPMRGLTRPEPTVTSTRTERQIVSLPPRDVELGLVARSGVLSSEVSKIHLKWAARDPAPVAQNVLPAITETRVALVIGNSAYRAARTLPNPASDAQAVAEALRGAGFKMVTVVKDASRSQLLEALDTFADQADTADWAVIYFAGHGIELNGTNYLIPVDARLRTDRNVPDEAVPLERVMAAIERAKKLRLIVLDACRDNPFVQQMRMTVATRSVSRGLARVEPEGGTLVAYAAKAGQVALDGDGRNSPFVSALVRRMSEPGLEINMLFRQVRNDVMTATGRKQEPFVYGSLPPDPFFFRPPQAN